MPNKQRKSRKKLSKKLISTLAAIVASPIIVAIIIAFITGLMNPWVNDINMFFRPTSATVEGTVYKGDVPYPGVIVRIDDKFDDKTRDGGTFIIRGISDNMHYIGVYTPDNDLLYCDKLLVNTGDKTAKKDINVDAIPKESIRTEEACVSNVFQFENQQANYKVNLMYAEGPSKTNPNLRDIIVWINSSNDIIAQIDRVTYYLHPTFSPNVITRYPDDYLAVSSKTYNFVLTMKAWGQFELNAKVYFKDKQIKDLSANMVFH